MSYEIKICDILKGAAMEGQYKGAQRGAKCEEIANELTRRGVKNNKESLLQKAALVTGWKVAVSQILRHWLNFATCSAFTP